MNATPPVRLYAVLVVSLLLLTAQFGLRAVGPHPLRPYLAAGAACAFIALFLAAYVALSAKTFSFVPPLMSNVRRRIAPL